MTTPTCPCEQDAIAVRPRCADCKFAQIVATAIAQGSCHVWDAPRPSPDDPHIPQTFEVRFGTLVTLPNGRRVLLAQDTLARVPTADELRCMAAMAGVPVDSAFVLQTGVGHG